MTRFAWTVSNRAVHWAAMAYLMEFEIIPAAWFSGQSWFVLLLITIAAFVVLIRAADLLVDNASALAYRIGMPKVIVGATIVSLGTTSPEAAVSVMAAWDEKPGFALGNAVGSIVADTGLIFGIGCLMMARLPVDRFVVNRQGWVQFGAGLALAVFCYAAYWHAGVDAQLGRWVGFVFLGALVAYMYASVRWARQRTRTESSSENTSDGAASGQPFVLLLLLALGLLLVVVSSEVLIKTVSELARLFRVQEVVIAGTIVALGTSLPELMVAIKSIRKNHPDLLIGNVIGADVLNVFFVVGASAAVVPLPIVTTTTELPDGSLVATKLPEVFLYVHLPAMLTILVLFRLFIASACRTGHFMRWQGAPLVGLYVAYVIVQYVVS